MRTLSSKLSDSSVQPSKRQSVRTLFQVSKSTWLRSLKKMCVSMRASEGESTLSWLTSLRKAWWHSTIVSPTLTTLWLKTWLTSSSRQPSERLTWNRSEKFLAFLIFRTQSSFSDSSLRFFQASKHLPSRVSLDALLLWTPFLSSCPLKLVSKESWSWEMSAKEISTASNRLLDLSFATSPSSPTGATKGPTSSVMLCSM